MKNIITTITNKMFPKRNNKIRLGIKCKFDDETFEYEFDENDLGMILNGVRASMCDDYIDDDED